MKLVSACDIFCESKPKQVFFLDPDKDHFVIVDTTETLQRHLSHRWDCLARQLNLQRQVIHDIRTKDTSDSDRIDHVIQVSKHVCTLPSSCLSFTFYLYLHSIYCDTK